MDASSETSATPTREGQTAMERIERLELNTAQLAQMVATMAHDIYALMQMLERAQVISVEPASDARLN